MDKIVYESLIQQIIEAKDFSASPVPDKETYEELISRRLVDLARLEAKNRYQLQEFIEDSELKTGESDERNNS